MHMSWLTEEPLILKANFSKIMSQKISINLNTSKGCLRESAYKIEQILKNSLKRRSKTLRNVKLLWTDTEISAVRN